MKKDEVVKLMLKNESRFKHIKMAEKKPVKRAVKAVKKAPVKKEVKKEEKKEDKKAIVNGKKYKSLINSKITIEDINKYIQIEKDVKEYSNMCRKEAKFQRRATPFTKRGSIVEKIKSDYEKNKQHCIKLGKKINSSFKNTNIKVGLNVSGSIVSLHHISTSEFPAKIVDNILTKMYNKEKIPFETFENSPFRSYQDMKEFYLKYIN